MAASSSYERNMDDVVGSDSSVVQNQIEFSKPCDSTVEIPRKLDAERKKCGEEMQGSSSKLPDEMKSRGKTIISENLAGDVIVKKHLNKRQGSSTEVASSIKNIISEDVEEHIPMEASEGRGANTCPGDELVGSKIKCWWPLDQMFYEGKVTSFDPSNKMHQIDYDDGDREILDLTKESWKLISDSSLSSNEQKTVSAPGASTETLSAHGRESPRRSKRKMKASMVGDASRCSGNELVGRKIKVWWPLDKLFYEGKVASFDPVNKTHQIDYDDGDHETLDLTEERWKLLGDDCISSQQQQKKKKKKKAVKPRRASTKM